MRVKIASIQPEYLHEEVERAVRVVAEQAALAEKRGAQLVCFPECFLQGYLFAGERTIELAMSLDSQEFSDCLHAWSDLESCLVVGLMERAGDQVFNTAVVVQGGKLLGAYRKRNLLEGESLLTPGRESARFEVDGLHFGIAICNDLNDPQIVADNCGDASLLVCPCNNMMRRENALQWKDRHHPSRAERARENECWLLSSDVTGAWKGRLALGPTSLLSPSGNVGGRVETGAPRVILVDVPVDQAVEVD